jgi:hypothetical protein
MSRMCALWASDWRFELENDSAPLRERSFEIDTIPKPGGLGFASASRGVDVQLLSSFCPGYVPLPSSLSLDNLEP